MELHKIKKRVEETKYKGGLRQLACDIGMTEANLHRCIRENKIQAQDLEKIAKLMSVRVGYFFDEEEMVQVREAGRDYVEKGKIEHHGTEYNAPVTMNPQCELEKENAELKRKLIEAQERIIKLLEEKR